MKRGKWVCSDRCRTAARSAALCWLIGLLCAVLGLGVDLSDAQTEQPAQAQAQTRARAQAAQAVAPRQAQVIVTDSAAPPAADDPRWRALPLGRDEPGLAAWYRVTFDAPVSVAGDQGPTLLYLPYFFGGGRVLLNGVPAADVPRSTATLRVRWERPFLLPLPGAALKTGDNQLLIRAHAEHTGNSTVLPGLMVGTPAVLQPLFERRHLLVRTVPMITWVAGTVVGLLVLWIWLQRRQEVLYGLFGLAALLWAQRTSTFVLETLPAGAWDAWRIVYHLCTGGFVVVMALYLLQLAGWSRKGLTRGLTGYWALGPVLFLSLGEGASTGWWTAGLAVIGLGMTVVAVAAAGRQRTLDTVAMAGAVALGFAAGVHDQLLATRSSLLIGALPQWSEHHLFLLHHAANVMLLVMGVLLSVRFVRSLNAVESANRTLEVRLKQREAEVAQSYQRIAVLQREQATTDERQRIMRDLHDGLGSQLFTSLMRVERGGMRSAEMADSLRSAIDQMRVTLEALSLEEQDFESAFGNFRFRWDARLRDAGLTPRWEISRADAAVGSGPLLAPHDTLQLLHVIQEALTNVLKHARATEVTVRVALQAAGLSVDVEDNGLAARGGAGTADAGDAGTADAGGGGRGRNNMQNRAQRLGGQVEWQVLAQGTRVHLWAPRRAPVQAGAMAADAAADGGQPSRTETRQPR